MSLRRPGPLALALGVIGLGVLAIATRGFVLFWDPIPAWVPAPRVLTVIYGALPIAAGLGLFFPRTRKLSARGLLLYALIWAVLSGLEAVRHPAEVGDWDNFCQALAVSVAAFFLQPGPPPSNAKAYAARAVLGVASVGLGLAHFGLVDFTASFVPAWLPAHRAIVYFTGAAFIAAGLALLIRRLDRLAVTLEAVMIGIFVLIIHVPSLFAAPPPSWAPTAAAQWTELLAALTIGGAVGTVAESLRSRPWGWRG